VLKRIIGEVFFDKDQIIEKIKMKDKDERKRLLKLCKIFPVSFWHMLTL
jgi:hypothetical protein